MSLKDELDAEARNGCADNTGCEACISDLPDVECGEYPDCEAAERSDLLSKGARIALEAAIAIAAERSIDVNQKTVVKRLRVLLAEVTE